MSNAVPAVITAALGLLAGYGSASAVAQPVATIPSQYEQNQDIQRLADKAHQVIGAARFLEDSFAASVKEAVEMGVRNRLDDSDHQRLPELLSNLRGLEVALKNAEVPDALGPIHMQMRRAVAKARSRVAELCHLANQAYGDTQVVEAKTSGPALHALAERSTKRLIEMANA